VAEAWERLSAENSEAYARFLIYKDLGPCRGLKKAYLEYLRRYDGFTGDAKRLHVPGQWYDDSRFHSWVDRAAAWDVYCLARYGAGIAALHVTALRRLAERNARLAGKLKPGDDGFADLLASVRLVAEVMTPDVVREIAERHRQPAAPGAPAPDPKGAVK
jgi:hypothetical protein